VGEALKKLFSFCPDDNEKLGDCPVTGNVVIPPWAGKLTIAKFLL